MKTADNLLWYFEIRAYGFSKKIEIDPNFKKLRRNEIFPMKH